MSNLSPKYSTQKNNKVKFNFKLIIAIIVFVISVVSTAFTFAWFTNKATGTGNFTFGTINIDADNGTDNEDVEVVVSRANGTIAATAMPGDYVSASVRVKNIGDCDLYYLVCFVCNERLLTSAYNNDYFYDTSLSTSSISTTVTKKVGALSVGKNQIINVNLQIDPKLTAVPEGDITINCGVYAIQSKNITEEEAYIELQKMKVAAYPNALRVEMYNEDGSTSLGSTSLTSQINVVYTDNTKTQFYLDGTSLNEDELVNDNGEQLYFFSDVAYTEPVTQGASLNSPVLYAAASESKYDTGDDSYIAKLSQTIYNFDVTYDINNKYIYDMPDHPLALHPVFLKSNEDTYVKGTTPYIILSKDRTSTAFGEFNKHTNIKFAVIPNTISTLTAGTFVNCSNLKHVVLPTSNLTIIDYMAFSYTIIENLILPKNITDLNTTTNYSGAFTDNSNLKSVTIFGALNNSVWAFSRCTSLTDVYLLGDTEALSKGLFQNCTSLTNVNLPDSLTTLDAQVFLHCTSLESIELPDTIETFGSGAFGECPNLKYINIPKNLKSLATLTFYGTSLTGSIGIPGECVIEDTSNGPFFGCTGITDFYLVGPSSMYIERNGIIYKKLTDTTFQLELMPCGRAGVLTIENDVTSVRRFEIENATYLTGYYVASSHPTLSVDEYGILYNKDKTTLRSFPSNSPLTHYDVPNSVTHIYHLESNNIVSATIPNSVVSLEGCAFSGNEKLKRINSNTDGVWDFSNTQIKSVAYKAMESCTQITHLILPATCTTIEGAALRDSTCTTITTYATSMVQLTANKYLSTGKLLDNTSVTTLNVLSAELKTAYEADTEWSVYTTTKKTLTVNVM